MRKNSSPIILEDVHVIDAGSEGKAVAKHEDKIVFVPFAVPGDIIDVKIISQKRNYAEGRLIAIKKSSTDRIAPKCQHFGWCGGCKWQQMSYEKQLFYKEKQVRDNLERIGKIDCSNLLPILGSEAIYHYRNKLDFSFSDRRWLSANELDSRSEDSPIEGGLGFHVPRIFDKVIDIHACFLQKDPSNDIRNALRDFAVSEKLSFYNARRHEGLMRNLILRTTPHNDIMVIVVFGEDRPTEISMVMDFLSERFPQITSLQYIVNQKFNDSIDDQAVILYRGLPYITEYMPAFADESKRLMFRIQAKSFFQTNSPQAYRLYHAAASLANLQPDHTVYDLYTGTGTIAHFIASGVKTVVGIEYVADAIADAQANALLNQHHNTAFYAGDMAKVFTPEIMEKHGKPDVIITDPPRAGMHEKVIERLIESEANKIIYISCNPATQARDLALLTDQAYTVYRIQPVDMFPHTQHVENIVELILR